MTNIVYILGAGFSAPMRIPVMSNFIEKSKDIYSYDSSKYAYFNEVFKMMRDKSYCKNFIKCDLFNIEEILSLIEMEYFVNSNNHDLELYKKYIKDVIKFYTPNPAIQADVFEKNFVPFHNNLFNNYQMYSSFVLSLMNLNIKRKLKDRNDLKHQFNIKKVESDCKYSIITMNYDSIIENVLKILFELDGKVDISDFINETKIDGYDENMKLNISKLHGSINTDIIMPTWNKTNSNNEIIKNNWGLAFENLSMANHIRFLGYSLPESDSYLKYFLSTAINRTENLKNIDVITLDDRNKATEKRYRDYFTFSKFRFKSAKIEDYLNGIIPNEIKINDSNVKEISYSKIIELNNYHNNFMDR